MRRRLRPRRPAAPRGRAPGVAPTSPHDPPGLAPMVLERVILHRLLRALGLPAPELHGVVGRAGGHSTRSGRPLPDIDATIAFLGDEVPDRFVIRPSAAVRRGATRVLRRDGDAVIDADGARTDVAALAAELLAAPHGMYLVQERLRDHPEWGAADALTPLRLTTLVGASGAVELVGADPRLPSAPGGDEAAALVRRAARHLLPLHRLTWSVALTADGPRLLGARPAALPVAATDAAPARPPALAGRP